MLKVATKCPNIVVRNDKTAISKYWMSPVLFVIMADVRALMSKFINIGNEHGISLI